MLGALVVPNIWAAMFFIVFGNCLGAPRFLTWSIVFCNGAAALVLLPEVALEGQLRMCRIS